MLRTRKDGSDTEVGCDIVRHEAALGIGSEGQVGCALHKGGTGDCTGMSIFDGFHSLPACAFELPQVDLPIGMPCQQYVALQHHNRHKSYPVDLICMPPLPSMQRIESDPCSTIYALFFGLPE